MQGHLHYQPLSKQKASVPATIEDAVAGHATRDFGKTGFREVTLTVFTRLAPAVSYKVLHIWRVEKESSCSSLFFLTEPAGLRGTAVKIVEYPYVDDMEIWLSLPTAKEPIRIGSHRSDQSVLGTDFSYSDLRFWLPTNAFDIKGVDFDVTSEGRICVLRVQQMRGTAAPREARLILDGTRWLPLTVEWLDPSGVPDRIYSASNLVRVDGVWTPRTISVSRPRDQFKSVMTLRRVLHRMPLGPNLFRTEYLNQLSESSFEKWIKQSHGFLDA